MKRLFVKVGRFFGSWRFLEFVLGMVALIILFYAEEDWRGARVWAATKAEWEARGESFDFNKLIPPPVPDDQNLAAIPLFKMEPDPKNKGELAPLALQKALRDDQPGHDLPTGDWGNYQRGKLPDMGKIREVIAADYAEAFKNAPPSNDPLAQFDALYPFIADLRTASAARPSCRFELNFQFEPHYDYDLSLVTAQIAISRILTFHAILALDAHQPDLALADIKTILKLASGLREQPLLVSGLVGIGVTSIGFSAVYDGLAFHAWSDAQLADLQNELARADFLSGYQRCLRGEISIAIPTFEHLKADRPRLAANLQAHDENKDEVPNSNSESRDYFPNFWANGWIDLWKAQVVNLDLSAVSFVDPRARRVFPQTVDRFTEEIEQRRHSWDAYAPWNIFSGIAAGPIANAVMQFAEIQVWVDQARIACALERYRLAHGVYPGALAALVPACIDDLPHDIMNGRPYCYQLRADGTYLLNSVGWNQTDDGGKVVFKSDAPRQINYHRGDWVWPTSQAAPAK